MYAHVPARKRIILLKKLQKKKKKYLTVSPKLERVYYERERERQSAEPSRTWIQPDEKLSKGQNTAPPFKGHALMVTLPQTLGNRPQCSPGSTRVVGDTRQTRPCCDEAFTWGSSTRPRSEWPLQCATQSFNFLNFHQLQHVGKSENKR